MSLECRIFFMDEFTYIMIAVVLTATEMHTSFIFILHYFLFT